MAGTAAKGINYHLLNNVGIPTELPGADPSLLASFGGLAQSGNLGSIIGDIGALDNPEDMLHIVEGVIATNPVSKAGSGVVGEFSALAGLTGPQAGVMKQAVNMFSDKQVYKDPNNANAWKQPTSSARAVTNSLIPGSSELAQLLQIAALPLYIPGIGQQYAPVFTPVSAALNQIEAVAGMLGNLLKLQAFQNPYSANPDEPTKELFDNPQIEILRIRSASSPDIGTPNINGITSAQALTILMDPASAAQTIDPAVMPVQSTTPFNSAIQSNLPVPVMNPVGTILYPQAVFYAQHPVEIRGILRDYNPGKMQVFEMSMNYSFPYTDLLSTVSGPHNGPTGLSNQGRNYNNLSTAPGGLAPTLVDTSSGYFIINSDPNSPYFVNDFLCLERSERRHFPYYRLGGQRDFPTYSICCFKLAVLYLS